MAIALPKGTHDVYLDEARGYDYIEQVMKAVANCYGYTEMRTPIFEHTELFQRSSGESSDVVRKEMYTFLDKGDRSITLRPELTAGIMRSIVTNKLYATIQDLPIKTWYLGPAFRYERPQAGRFRQFNQFGIESVGVSNYLHDFEVIMLGYNTLLMLGLKNVTIKINSLGDQASRDAYREALRNYFSDKIENMCEDCKQRFEINPLRILDCKVPEDHEIAKNAPKMSDYLTPEAREYFDKILKLLDSYGMKYEVDDSLVRGLDYYSHVVFEFHYTASTGKDIGAIGAGGHYGNLLKEVGGPDMAGVGLAFGIERVYSVLKDDDLLEGIEEQHDVSVMCLDDKALLLCYDLASALRASGYRVDMMLEAKGFKQQFKRAERKNSSLAAIIGSDELEKEVVILRDLKNQTQIEVPVTHTMEQIHAFFEGQETEHEHGCCCGHDHDEEHECCCGHDHDQEHECCGGHDEEHECCCGGHHDDEHECCCGGHHDDEHHEYCCEHKEK